MASTRGRTAAFGFYISRGHRTIYARSSDAGESVWDGRWHLAVGTFDGNTIKLYLDGVEVGAGTAYPGPIEYQLSDSNNLFIGAYPSCGAENFAGAIGDVRIWNIALTASQVSMLDQTTLPPPAGGAPVTPVPQIPDTPMPSTEATSQPVLRTLQLSGSTLSAAAVAHKSVITYADSEPASVRFTVLKLAPKAKCATPVRQAHKKVPKLCPRFVKFGQFTHRDQAGRNRVRFPARLKLTPGKYRLEATPTFRGTVGRTVIVMFTIR